MYILEKIAVTTFPLLLTLPLVRIAILTPLAQRMNAFRLINLLYPYILKKKILKRTKTRIVIPFFPCCFSLKLLHLFLYFLFFYPFLDSIPRFLEFCSNERQTLSSVDIPGFCLSLANCPRCTCLRMKAKGPRRLEACGWRVLLVPDSVSPPLSCFRSLSAIISITTAAATTSTALWSRFLNTRGKLSYLYTHGNRIVFRLLPSFSCFSYSPNGIC